MNQRERILASIVGVFAVGLTGYLCIDKFVLSPARTLDGQIRDTQTKLADARKLNARDREFQGKLRDLAKKTLAHDDQRTSEILRARLVEVLKASGLSGENLSLRPVAGTRINNIYRELGWFVKVRGRLEQLVNYLYLLQSEPYLNKLDGPILQPIERSPEVELQFRYTTLILDPLKGEKPPATQPIDALPMANLASNQRTQYAGIMIRDLLRPYVPRNGQPQYHSPSHDHGQPSQSPDQRYLVAGLPSWGGQAEIMIKDLTTNQTQVLRVGDSLAGGKIIAVDYRSMPMPERPELRSGSRVILEIEDQYWAVELGQTLAKRRMLEQAQLPPELAGDGREDGIDEPANAPAPTTVPATPPPDSEPAS